MVERFFSLLSKNANIRGSLLARIFCIDSIHGARFSIERHAMSTFENRKSERYLLKIPVEVRTSSAVFSGWLKDISATGMGLDNSFVSVECGENIVVDSKEHGIFVGKVQWKTMNGFGLEFDDQTRNSMSTIKLIRSLKDRDKDG